jgi:hypothetical protein
VGSQPDPEDREYKDSNWAASKAVGGKGWSRFAVVFARG